jgi:hypothetical protein
MTGAARPQQWLADDLGDAIFRVEVAVEVAVSCFMI